MSGFNIISEDVGDFYERYYYGFAGEQNKYYCSIRAIKNQFTQEYRIIPFVFLPKLSDSSYNELKQDVFKKLGIQALSLDVQIEYELIQLYISQSLLNSWAKKSKINLSPQNYDLTKIILNFGLNEDGKIISKEIFSRLFNDEYLLSYEELVSILNNATKDSPSYDSLCSTKHSLNTHIENWMFTTIMEELLENYIRSIRYIARRGEFGENYEYGQKNNWNYSLYSIIGKILQENSAPIDEVIRDLWRLIDGRYANTSIKADATDKNYCGETLQVNFGATVLLNIKYAQYMSLLVYLCQFELKKGKSVAETLEPCLRDAKEKGLIDSETDIGLLSAQLINYLDWLKKVGSDPLEWSHIKFDSYPIITNLSNNIYHFGLKWASVDTDLKKRKLYRLSKSKYPM